MALLEQILNSNLVTLGLVIIVAGVLIYMRFIGFKKHIIEILTSLEISAHIKQRIEEQITFREKSIKAKPVYLVYQTGEKIQSLSKLLSDAGYTNVTAKAMNETFQDLKPNTVVVFVDRNSDHNDAIAKFIINTPQVNDRGHFFYFGRRFEHPDIEMRNFANSLDTLPARLFESLSIS